MKRIDRIKLDFTRNWKLPGKERLAGILKASAQLKLTIENGIVWLNNEDIAIYTSADNYIEWLVLSTGSYEDEINKLIRLSLKTGENALDIGGNIGIQSLRMAQCVSGSGKVFSFEPLAFLREKFNRNILLNNVRNITLFPFALADEENEADFGINSNSWNLGTFSLKDKNEGAEKQLVMIKVGDSIPEIEQLPSLSLIKIDVEGFEFHVLRGLRQTLEKHRPRIIFEFDSNYWLDTGQRMADCYDFLQLLGYLVYQITPVGCELKNNHMDIESGNLFCIPV